jgi:protein ImuB
MPLSEASALTKLHLEKFDPRADRMALEKLAKWCEQFSPTVAVEGPDCLLMDMTGLAHLYNGEDVLVDQVQRAFRKLQLVTRIAVTDTFTAAWAITHFGDREVVLVPPGEVKESLTHLPVASLNLCEAINVTLFELGIEEIGQLLTLSPKSLAARFDSQLLDRLQQATGEIQESITPYHHTPDLTAVHEFEYPVSDRRILEFVLGELLETTIAKLLAERKGITKFTCEFVSEFSKPIRIPVALYQATAQLKHLKELIELKLEKLFLEGPVNKVRLLINTTALLTTSQLELFEGENSNEQIRQRSLLVNRLTSRLGETAVLRAVLIPDAQAEFAYRYQPVTLAKSRNNRKSVKIAKPFQRPLQLLPVPSPLKVVGVLAGPPKQFEWRGEAFRIHAVSRPERIEVGWWRGNYVRRDYFRVETEQGNRFWLFRDRQGRWFLHGIFD